MAETRNGQTGPMEESYFTSPGVPEATGFLVTGLRLLGQRRLVPMGFGVHFLTSIARQKVLARPGYQVTQLCPVA